MEMKNLAKITLPLVGGLLIGKYATANAQEDYKKYKQPPFSPPGIAFPIVWPILYTSMGVSHYLIGKTEDVNERKNNELNQVYFTQLSLNYLWSLLYFRYKQRGLALVESFMLLGSATVTMTRFNQVNKVAGKLLIPYVAWLSYASYLNAGSYVLNKDKENYLK